MPFTWEAILALEGEPTDDGRLFQAGAFSWRDLPLTLMAQTVTDVGHDGAQVAGRIESITRSAGLVIGAGVFDDSAFGNEIARMADEGTLTGVSVDVSPDEYELAPNMGQTIEEDEDGTITVVETVWIEFTKALIMGATVTPFPAFSRAKITGVGGQAAEAEAVAAGGVLLDSRPALPPLSWFEDPALDAPTPLTVTAQGRIFGHVAAWGTCHIGMPGRCVEAPTSATGYSQFLLGELEAEGGRVAVGQITLGTGHAPLSAGRTAAMEHYEHTGTAVADVSVGEDGSGIWVAGALRSGVTPEQVHDLMAAKPSGDWRDFGGNLELVGILAVNVPGFPVPRTRVAAGSPDHGLAMVAAGVVRAATRRARLSGRIIRVGHTEGGLLASGEPAPWTWAGEVQARALADLADRAHEPELRALATRL